MKSKILLLISLSLFCLSSIAQSDPKAKAILDKTVKQMQGAATKSSFELLLVDTKTEKKETVKGEVYMKGKKFKVVVPSVHTYFDGKSQYVHVLKNKEVTITTPTKDELAETNPAYFLSSYSVKSSIQFSQDNKPNFTYHIIDIFPDFAAKKDYFKVTVLIDKKTSSLMSVKVFSRNGVQSTIKLTKLDFAQKLDDTFFVFDFVKNPKIIKNDLR